MRKSLIQSGPDMVSIKNEKPGQILSVRTKIKTYSIMELDGWCIRHNQRDKVNVIVDEAIKSELSGKAQFLSSTEFAQANRNGARCLRLSSVELSLYTCYHKDTDNPVGEDNAAIQADARRERGRI